MTQYEELKKSIADLAKKIETPTHYDYFDSNLPNYAKPTIKKLINKGYLNGDSSGRLDLSGDMLRILVILDRSGAFDK